MKKLYWIFGVIALFFVGDRVAGYVLEQLVLKSQFRYSRLYNGVAEADILLVGNSRGLSFYQPYIEEMTGESTFNLSYSAMPMTLAEVLVRDYLERYPAPKKMLVDITICDRENDPLIAGFNAYSSLSPRLDSLVTSTSKSIGYGGKLSHIFRYNGEIFQRALYYLNKDDETWLLDREMGQRLKDDIQTVEEPTVELVPRMVESLVRAVNLAKSKGIDVKLVVSPYYLPFAKRISNLDQMIAQVEKATGMKVFDYSRSMAGSDDFGDYQHINIRGSKQYIAMMKRDGLIP